MWSENKDFRKTLDEQLVDMTTGMCPQGRTVRLCQAVNAYLT